MSLLTIIIIGILILLGISYWATQAEKKTFEFETDLKISPTDFERDFEKLKINGGTLCFWGNWFGKPMDNYHQIKSVEFDSGTKLLKLTLDESEKLMIWNPSDIELARKELRIKKADKILFEWHLYGENKTDENLRFESYKNNGLNIVFSTDFMPDKRNTKCSILKPALSIIGY